MEIRSEQRVRDVVSESQRILTNVAFFLEEQLSKAEMEKEQVIKEKMALHLCYKDLQKEYKTLVDENAKLKSKLESMETYAKELGEGICKSTKRVNPEYSFEVGV